MASGNSLTLDVTTFQDLFPEFLDADFTVLEAQLRRTCFATNEYKGVKSNCGQDRQYYALYLHMAHQLALTDRFSGDCEKTPVVKEKSKNDEIQYAVDPKIVGGTGLESTRYGQELIELLRACSTGIGYMTCNASTYCC